MNKKQTPQTTDQLQIEVLPVQEISRSKTNPRLIKDHRFKKLVQSIRDFPEMMRIRPIVLNKDMIVIGGSMRLAACIEAGWTEVPVIRAENLTEKQQKEFAIKDNVSYGEWDFDMLANEWEQHELIDFGMDEAMFPVDDKAAKFEFDEDENNEEQPEVDQDDVKMLHLFFNMKTHEEFVTKGNELMDHFKVSTITDLSLEVMRYAHNQIIKKAE